MESCSARPIAAAFGFSIPFGTPSPQPPPFAPPTDCQNVVTHVVEGIKRNRAQQRREKTRMLKLQRAARIDGLEARVEAGEHEGGGDDCGTLVATLREDITQEEVKNRYVDEVRQSPVAPAPAKVTLRGGSKRNATKSARRSAHAEQTRDEVLRPHRMRQTRSMKAEKASKNVGMKEPSSSGPVEHEAVNVKPEVRETAKKPRKTGRKAQKQPFSVEQAASLDLSSRLTKGNSERTEEAALGVPDQQEKSEMRSKESVTREDQAQAVVQNGDLAAEGEASQPKPRTKRKATTTARAEGDPPDGTTTSIPRNHTGTRATTRPRPKRRAPADEAPAATDNDVASGSPSEPGATRRRLGRKPLAENGDTAAAATSPRASPPPMPAIICTPPRARRPLEHMDANRSMSPEKKAPAAQRPKARSKRPTARARAPATARGAARDRDGDGIGNGAERASPAPAPAQAPHAAHSRPAGAGVGTFSARDPANRGAEPAARRSPRVDDVGAAAPAPSRRDPSAPSPSRAPPARPDSSRACAASPPADEDIDWLFAPPAARRAPRAARVVRTPAALAAPAIPRPTAVQEMDLDDLLDEVAVVAARRGDGHGHGDDGEDAAPALGWGRGRRATRR